MRDEVCVYNYNRSKQCAGIDFVSQALAHIEDRDKQRLLGEWAKLRDG
jgi:hypothetical protein